VELFNNGNWVVTALPATIPERPFVVSLNGRAVPRADTRLLAFSNRDEGSSGFPQVYVLYSSGYFRLKAGADPSPALPFGASVILGPAVYAGGLLYSSPQLNTVDIDTSGLRPDGTGSLRLRLSARGSCIPPVRRPGQVWLNELLDADWTMELHEPTASSGVVTVTTAYRCTRDIAPDPARTGEQQSFRLVQVSAMYISSRCHDVDSLRYTAAGVPVHVCLRPSDVGALIPPSVPVLGRPPVEMEALHTENEGCPNGDTPSLRIRVEEAPFSTPLVLRAGFDGTTDPTQDNFSQWLHQDPPAIAAGATGTIRYRVTATTDPSPPAPRCEPTPHGCPASPPSCR
jgi:hypothetical protein